ncbi:MAG: ComF family protein [Fimbriimonas ginsengisoli]|uniref:ComF family protein n=1 Tax=Fimbriimonas ginsengisoli TaxID=1005039 RepID=A0A931LS43_FIMGI|nr:ComF family protein [Fimbriimonas ginsengisoli]MBI3721598.1 ComF family protein [Fimbriimonas ginsengisoli]
MNAAKASWTRFFDPLLDWAYPRRCALCAALGDLSICEGCLGEFSPNPVALDPSEPLRWQFSVYRYESRVAQAVRRLKYSGATALARPLASTLADSVQAHGLLEEGIVIVPVPIHWTRRALRGFNQAAVLCEKLPTSLVRRDLLRRVRPTRPQAGLSPSERQRNLEHAFGASPKAQGLRVLLVDDVITTGHTVHECAKALLAQGAESVAALALAGNATP